MDSGDACAYVCATQDSRSHPAVHPLVHVASSFVTRLLLAAALVALVAPSAVAQPSGDSLRVLVVTAHPDDETLMAGAIYKLTHAMGAAVDLALVTDGSGGFHYAMVGEAYYGVEIDTESEARTNLPPIRREELRDAGRILGLRDLFFLGAYDHEYTTDADTVLQHVWDAAAVRDSLGAILARGRYGLVLALLPTDETHGHHKAATILALDAASRIPLPERPVVLGADIADAADLPAPDAPPYAFAGLDAYPVTRIAADAPVFRFDRRQPMEDDGVIDYRMVVNWALAAHKSQGDLAGYFNKGDYEFYWWFGVNDPARLDAVTSLFDRLDESPYR